MLSTLLTSIGLFYAASAALPKFMTNGGGYKPLGFGEVCQTNRVMLDRVVPNVAECRKVSKAIQEACFRNPKTCNDVFKGNVIEVNSDNFPMGCFFTAEAKLYFNVNSANWKNPLARPICGISTARRPRSQATRTTNAKECPICGDQSKSTAAYLQVSMDFGTDSKLITCERKCLGETMNANKICWNVNCHPKPETYTMNFDDVLPKRSASAVEGVISSDTVVIGVGASVVIAVVALGYVVVSKKPAGSYDPVVDI